MIVDDEALIEAVEDLVHDVAKYMVFETRFVDGLNDKNALFDALRADLCSTRKTRQPDGSVHTESAWSMWSRMLPTTLSDHPLARKISSSMIELSHVDWDDAAVDVDRVACIAREASASIRVLLDEVRQTCGGENNG